MSLALILVLLAAQPEGEPGRVAFEDVNVLPMDAERVLAHQTVSIRDGFIEEISPWRSSKLAPGAKRILGNGDLYLMPGLADMHVHAERSEDLLLYVTHGVTTVLNLGGARGDLVHSIRDKIEKGEILGPHCYVSFIIDGSGLPDIFFVKSAEEARAAVRLAKTNGYDFIKVYNTLSREAFFAIIDEARSQGLAVGGHGVRSVGLKEQLAAGQVMVAHGEEFIYSAFWDKLDEAQVPEVVAWTKASGAYVIPNLSAFNAIARQWGKPAEVREFLRQKTAHDLREDLLLDWLRSRYAKRQGSLSKEAAFLKKLTRALSDAAVPLMTGTDSPVIPGMFPGASEWVDIQLLIDAGLSRFQALSAATRIPGVFIHANVAGAPRFGTVAVGNRADLLLVRGNPLQDISALTRIEGVMLAGRWYPRSVLEEHRKALRARFEQADRIRRNATSGVGAF